MWNDPVDPIGVELKFHFACPGGWPMLRFVYFLSPIGLIACQSDLTIFVDNPQNSADSEAADDEATAQDEGWSLSDATANPDLTGILETFQDSELPLDMFEIRVVPAEFVRGISPEDEDFDLAHVPHTVELTHEWTITETEITYEQFIHYMGYNPSELWGNDGDASQCADCPVAFVSWSEAQAFGNAMSSAHGLESCFECTGEGADVVCEPISDPYECNGFRLPTEAEWEHAARGGEDFTFPGSDEIDAVAYWEENSGNQAYPVASKLPNGFGLYDMGGNARERVYDAFHPYSGADLVDPVVYTAYLGDLYAERGGSWACRRAEIRWNRRNLVWDYMRDTHTGFRVARIID